MLAEGQTAFKGLLSLLPVFPRGRDLSQDAINRDAIVAKTAQAANALDITARPLLARDMQVALGQEGDIKVPAVARWLSLSRGQVKLNARGLATASYRQEMTIERQRARVPLGISRLSHCLLKNVLGGLPISAAEKQNGLTLQGQRFDARVARLLCLLERHTKARLTLRPVALCQRHDPLVAMQPANNMLNAVAARTLKTLLIVMASLLHLSQHLVDRAQTLIAQRRVKGIAQRDIQFVSLRDQANRLVDMLSPAAYPAQNVQSKSLCSPIPDLRGQLMRLPELSLCLGGTEE